MLTDKKKGKKKRGGGVLRKKDELKRDYASSYLMKDYQKSLCVGKMAPALSNING